MARQDEDVVFVDAAESGLHGHASKTTQENTEVAMSGSKGSADKLGHPCPHCSKSFERLEHLERHSRKHSGEKPFTCLHSGCEKGFSRYDNMIQHYHCHFDKGHRRKKRDLRETLKRSFMEQEGEARPLTPAENLTLRTLVQASFTPSYPCPAPLPRGRKPSRSRQLAGNHHSGRNSLMTTASGSPFTSASQSPMSFSRSTSPSDGSSMTSASSSPASPAPSVSTAPASSSLSSSSISSSTLPFSSPPSDILTPQLNEVLPPPPPPPAAAAPPLLLPSIYHQPTQYFLPPTPAGRMYSINPRCQVDEAQLKLLKPKMF